MAKLFSYDNIDFTSPDSQLFLGKGRNLSRLELDTESHITKLKEDARAQLWFGSDYNYNQDGIDFTTTTNTRRTLSLKNLKFQVLLDSLASRTVAEVFLPITTNPQLESWWFLHAFFENNIHSEAYAEIVKSLPIDAKAEFDTIMVDDNILNRARSLIATFEDTVRHNARQTLNYDYDVSAHRKSIIKSLYALNILENVLFKSSFLTTFAFKENGLFDSSASAVSKIAIDENFHYAMTVNLLNRLRTNPEWAADMASQDTVAISMYKKAADADFIWINHLDVDSAELLSLSSKGLKEYVKYNTNLTTNSVGLDSIFDKTPNPMKWADKYTKLSAQQTAQKSKEGSSYSLGAISMDFNWEDLNI